MTPANNSASHSPFYQKMNYFTMVRQGGDAGKSGISGDIPGRGAPGFGDRRDRCDRQPRHDSRSSDTSPGST